MVSTERDLRTRIAAALLYEDQKADWEDAIEAGVEHEWLAAADAVIRVIKGDLICECGEPLDHWHHASREDVLVIHGKYSHAFNRRGN